MPFLKFQYGNKIKKTQVSYDELSWQNILDILTKWFRIVEKDKLKITYKDLENDEITICSDEDLKEACNLYLTKDLIRFFVYYSGNIKPNSPLRGSRKTSQEEISSSKNSKNFMLEESKSTGSQFTQSNGLAASQQQTKKLQIDAKELEEIFTEVFTSTGVMQKIQEKMHRLIKKTEVNVSETIEYSVETDYTRLSLHMMNTVNKIVNQKCKGTLNQSSSVLIEQCTFTPIGIAQTNEQAGFLSIKETPLTVSCYETLTKQCQNTLVDVVKPATKTMEYDPTKSLADSAGFRFVMKFENGKAKFVPVLKDSINEKKDSETIESAKIVGKDRDEFSDKILKDNVHDLDDDLPAPYDHDKVQRIKAL